ncbi:hypothetical protein [Streptomyces sp. NPDC018693]|uniref:hypothetical protein n=1 Tax=unclassified Streptomyces TaxID=2593676 RepID=UPI0037B27C5D
MSNEISLPDGITAEDLAAALEVVRQNKARNPGRPRARGRDDGEETIFVRGEGGAVFEMAPSRMTADMRRRMQMGRLRRVTPDGRPYRPVYDTPAPAAAPEDPGAGGGHSDLTGGRVPRPAKSAPKKDWVLYAVAELRLDEETALGMTRQELIELPVDHADHADLPPGAPLPAAAGGGRPDEDAPKAAWIDYVARQGLLSRDDAEVYTREDLIAMVS